VAAWAGLLWTTSAAARPLSAMVGLGAAVVVGWLLSDGLVPGATSPVLDLLALPSSSGLRGGPAVGLVAALLIGIGAGALGGSRSRAAVRTVAGPADTVEG